MVTKYDTGDVVLVPVELDAARLYDDSILYTPDIREDLGDRCFAEENIAGLHDGGNTLFLSREIKKALSVVSHMNVDSDSAYMFYPLTDEQREAIDALWKDVHSRHPLDTENLPVCSCSMKGELT